MKKISVVLTLFTLFLLQCQTGPLWVSPTQKCGIDDPFCSTMAESQFFDLKTGEEQVVEGKDGTIIVFPEGCFVTQNGEEIKGTVKVELAEALKRSDIVRSNLTTFSNGQPLETGGMIYLNITANGQQAGICPKHPAWVQIPAPEKKSGMKVYHGIRDANGNMNWVDPEPIDNSITAVDIFSLDFLPDGFRAAVVNNLPFANYTESSTDLEDSLYYSLSGNPDFLWEKDFRATEMNEPYYNPNKEVQNGEYTPESYGGQVSETAPTTESSRKGSEVDPAMIKVIHAEQFQGTLLATKEFEQRLQTVFKTCNNKVLEAYVTNLDKNLWELDKLAAQAAEECGEIECTEAFHRFAEQGLGKVKNGKRYHGALKRYFIKQVRKVRDDIKAKQQELRKELATKNKAAEATRQEYRDLLWKREKYRMETYGFNWTSTGWLNVDRGTEPKTWAPGELEILVDNYADFDRVYTYVIYENIKSMYRLDQGENGRYSVGNQDDKEVIMPKNQQATVIAIGYKGYNSAIAQRQFFTTEDTHFSLHLNPASTEEVKGVMNRYDDFENENQIAADLLFMDEFYAEDQRQQALSHDRDVMRRLYWVAFPCFDYGGMKLFEENCAICHHQNLISKLTGPALLGVKQKWNDDVALYSFIRNSQRLIGQGYPRAVEQWKMWKPTLMSDFEDLTDDEIAEILKFTR